MDWQEEKERQARDLIRKYPKSHRFLEAQLGPTLTPVLEEEVGIPSPQQSYSPLPPLPGESPPLPPLPGDFSMSPNISLSPDVVTSMSPSSPEVEAVASVRSSVKELRELEELMEKQTPTPPLSGSSPSPLVTG